MPPRVSTRSSTRVGGGEGTALRAVRYELRPRLGLRPWLAFFFRARRVAFLVRFDIRGATLPVRPGRAPVDGSEVRLGGGAGLVLPQTAVLRSLVASPSGSAPVSWRAPRRSGLAGCRTRCLRGQRGPPS